MENLLIKSGQGNYTVNFFDDVCSIVAELEKITNAIVFIDKNVASLYKSAFVKLTSTTPTLIIEATEDEKTLKGVTRALGFLKENKCNRQSVIIAIGGGIIQDIATFTAHIYYRGIRCIFVPTTLLSMCDSCIGAKCGINFDKLKNQLGVFHSPTRIFIATKFLDTLPETDIISGYGEILKLLLTGSKELYLDFKNVVYSSGFRNSDIEKLIYESLKVKQGVIEQDEYETDLRRILNYGHSFGHALEMVTNYEVPHGHAVAWGIDLVNYISLKNSWMTESDYVDIHKLIEKYFSTKISKDFNAKILIGASKSDKKVADGKLNLAILKYPGCLEIVPVVFNEAIENTIDEYLKISNVLYSN